MRWKLMERLIRFAWWVCGTPPGDRVGCPMPQVSGACMLCQREVILLCPVCQGRILGRLEKAEND